jgi:cyclic pyranopterin phosphate synthase
MEGGDGARVSHLGQGGEARMVDVGAKPITARTAEAEAWVRFPPAAFQAVLDGRLPKGGLVETARLAGIQAAKRTADLIPMCHPLALDAIQVEIAAPDASQPALRVRCRVQVQARTGVEMEAMVGAAVAALTLYDMTKALDRGIQVESVRLIGKSGGKSGTWAAQ